MSTSRAKRQFAGDAAQRSITSYFSSASSGAAAPATTTPTTAAATDYRPQLPASVQANLINVGMRVRKSVPEGYKTGKEISGIGLFTNNAKAPAVVSRAAAPATRVVVPSKPSELMPFCGIHKTGGLDHDDAADVTALNDVPGLSYSQGSAASANSADEVSWGGRAVASRKRLNDDDVDVVDEDEAEGNRILAPKEGVVDEHDMIAAGRAIAIPRRRKTVTATDDDFEEAPFLDAAGMR